MGKTFHDAERHLEEPSVSDFGTVCVYVCMCRVCVCVCVCVCCATDDVYSGGETDSDGGQGEGVSGQSAENNFTDTATRVASSSSA